MKRTQVLRLALASFSLGLALALPFLTGQIPAIGSMLLPMHLPVLICGFLCGWPYGLLVGLIAPLLRSALFGMPPLMPTALAMAFELAVYGGVAGICYRIFRRSLRNVYISLAIAMLAGRIVWGMMSIWIYALFMDNPFTVAMFWAGAFVKAWPGIAVQVVVVPLVVLAMEKAKFFPLANVKDDGTKG